MTENEAIKEIKCWLNVYAGSRIAPEMVQATGMAIKALEEVQQYRKPGVTAESALNNMCDLAAAENLIEAYRAIGTPEEFRAEMERQAAMKRHCDEKGCLNCPYNNPLSKENKCMNDFVIDGSDEE